jgi:acetyltransferase EpsM
MEVTNTILYGAGGHAMVVLDILENMNIKVDFLVDDDPNKSVNIPYQIKNFYEFLPKDKVILAMGSNKARQIIAKRLSCQYINAIHPSAILSDKIVMGLGNVMMAGAIINSGAKIGNHCIVNTGAIVEHDCVLEDFVHISPNATLCGNVSVGEGAQVGAGAVVIPEIKIGKWAVIGAGSVIIKDVPDGATVVGNPGRIIK